MKIKYQQMAKEHIEAEQLALHRKNALVYSERGSEGEREGERNFKGQSAVKDEGYSLHSQSNNNYSNDNNNNNNNSGGGDTRPLASNSLFTQVTH